jgi:hypothetical protein
MRTYLLEAERPEDLAILRHPKWRIRRKWRRAVLVTEDEKIAPPFELIRRSVAGERMLDQSKLWLTRSILDDLHDEYVKASPVPAKVAAGAEKRWLNARKAQEAASKKLAEAKIVERVAANDLVKTHGKAAIVINGVTLYPSYVEDSVSNSQVQGHAGTYARWAPMLTKRKKKS